LDTWAKSPIFLLHKFRGNCVENCGEHYCRWRGNLISFILLVLDFGATNHECAVVKLKYMRTKRRVFRYFSLFFHFCGSLTLIDKREQEIIWISLALIAAHDLHQLLELDAKMIVSSFVMK
jgi:hypothetical protein